MPRSRVTSPNPGAEERSPAGKDRLRALEAERQSLVAIVNFLRANGASTRLDLERKLRLGRAVVSDRLATLSALGLIDESGTGRSGGGRAPRLIRFRSEAGRLLVANIDGDTIGIGLTDLAGRLMFEHFEDFDAGASVDALFERLENLFGWSIRHNNVPLWAIGFGIPGAVESRDNAGLAVPILGTLPAWTDARLLERLIEGFNVPLWARSAVQMETVGESGTMSVDRGSDVLFVDLGSQISAGLVAEGRLHRGAQGIAGQIGHVYAGEGHTAVCGCGNVGCLQTVAGCEAIAREAIDAARDGRSRLLTETLTRTGTVTVSDVGTASSLGDPFCAELLARSGHLIGTVLATMVNLLNPSAVVIAGELAQTGDICLAAIRESIYKHSQPLVSRDIVIIRSRMGRSSGLVGAAMLVLEEIFATDFIENWITSGTPLAHPDVVGLIQDVNHAGDENGDTSQRRAGPFALSAGMS